jgi:hypothetical protein
MSTQAQITTAPLPASWSDEEQSTLRALRARYQQGRDLFSAAELGRLHFYRWLYDTGRLIP